MPPESGCGSPSSAPSVGVRLAIASPSSSTVLPSFVAIRRAAYYARARARRKGSLGVPSPCMTLDELRAEVAAGTIDTVLLALTDMQGRLQGKRLTATHFLDEVVEHGAEGCNYLLAVDVDMNT